MRRFVALAALVALFQPAASAAPGTPAPAPPPALADRDGNGISDDVQARLAAAAPNDRFDVVVTFDGPGNAASARAAVGDFELRREFRIIRGFAATMTAAQARGLARRPEIFRVEDDFEVRATMEAARRDFGADVARTAYGATGAGIGICVADTGADPEHEQLDGGKIAGWNDLVRNQESPYDDHGHGTHVAAIAAGDGAGGAVAARHAGVAAGAPVYAAKVLDVQGRGADSVIIAGVEWCAAQPAVRVISMSLGSPTGADGEDSLSQAVNAAAKGLAVVVAAGNSGDAPETVGSPGAASGAITVGAVAAHSGPAQGIYIAPFSSRGPTLDGRTKPDIAAPGVSVASADAGTRAGYVSLSGTSMATPFAAGAVALALEKRPSWGAADVRTTLEGTAQDRGPAGKDDDWGAGLIDVHGLVAAAAGSSGATVFPVHARAAGTVPNNGVWRYAFDVTDPTQPVAAMMTIEGEPVCVFYCFAVEWSPDLDMRLKAPNGTVIAQSICATGAECGIGRQETIHFLPAATGTYTLEVFPFADEPNNGRGGPFALDLSGAVGGVAAPPPAAALHVGDLDAAASAAKKAWTARVTITVHDAGGTSVAGAKVTGSWSSGGSASCTTGTSGTCTATASVNNRKTSVTYSVTGVSASGYTYDAASNRDPETDSNGTTITLSKP